MHAEAEPGSEAAVSESLAMVLFDRGNREAAKELLCDQRRYYDVFQASATPCRVRTQWSADKVEAPVSPTRPAPAVPLPHPATVPRFPDYSANPSRSRRSDDAMAAELCVLLLLSGKHEGRFAMSGRE